ncbi:Uncharacterised protein [Achromobacter sp. 2789STDY5608621]|nr:Uncharacterised protein [Achromobacter sp. 2789STDY5608621]
MRLTLAWSEDEKRWMRPARLTSSVSALITVAMPVGAAPFQRGPATRYLPPPLPVARLPR